MRRPRTATAAAAALVCCASLAACSNTSTSSADSAAKPTATATVAKRDLVTTATTSGSLGYAATYPLPSGTAGTVTALPDKGAIIKEGQALYSIDTRPIVRLDGSLPAWRALGSGVSDGKDVEQLEQGLTDLGYGSGLTVDDHWSAATTAAVKRWQKALGVKQTGSFSLGQVIFTPGDVRVDTLTAHTGDTVAPGAAIAQIGPTTRVVTTTLSSNVTQTVATGDSVDVVFADGTKATGKVRSVENQTEQDGSSSRLVTIGVKHAPAAASDTAGSVRTTFSNILAKDALVVPVSALVALSGGGYGVQKVAANGTTSYVSVTPGQFANTDVQISSGDLVPGDKVSVTP